jgi:hypothetical protein
MCHSRQLTSQGAQEDPVHRQHHINPYAKPNHDAVRHADYYQDDAPKNEGNAIKVQLKLICKRRTVRNFMFPPRSRWDMRSSGILRSVSGDSLPTFRDNLPAPSSRARKFLTLEDGAVRLSLNVGKELPLTLRNIPEERRSQRDCCLTKQFILSMNCTHIARYAHYKQSKITSIAGRNVCKVANITNLQSGQTF